MSRTTFGFTHEGKEYLLTVSSHGYYQIFDRELRDKVTWYARGGDEKGWRVNPKYLESELYKGECEYDLDLKLNRAEMKRMAEKFFQEFLEAENDRKRN